MDAYFRARCAIILSLSIVSLFFVASNAIAQSTASSDEFGASSIREWLLSQGVSTVILIALLYGSYKGFSYVIRDMVPRHLAEIQRGYERIESSHERQLVDLSTIFESRVKAITETFEHERNAERTVANSIERLTEELHKK